MGLPASLIKFELFLRRLTGRADDASFSQAYWAARYRWGGNSGKGSRGQIAAEKSAFVSQFCAAQGIASLAELGSGDGVCASQIHVPHYLGLDLSEDAIAIARKRCDPATHRFVRIAGDSPEVIAQKVIEAAGGLPQASLSMDVILHLVEDATFEAYLRTLFAISGRYIIIFSSDEDGPDQVHVRHRAYSRHLMADFPVRLVTAHGDGMTAHFKVFEKL